MKWVTRERPVIDRIACPWLIARFIDKEPGVPFRAAGPGDQGDGGDRSHPV
ncbi:chromate resistance protein ChrB domain-containing protein [Sinorhizobium saheli]|uniref:chromate resistance protein ChrB domain-containing protein n=1 Tax=Sinorhizobium saheli TaxID=36856 RepID=UPI000A761F53